jgi:hypothetical protein
MALFTLKNHSSFRRLKPGGNKMDRGYATACRLL